VTVGTFPAVSPVMWFVRLFVVCWLLVCICWTVSMTIDRGAPVMAEAMAFCLIELV
jgi:hypothetical protein